MQTGGFQPGALPPGYVPLGDAQKQQITDARKKIADAPKWTGRTPPPTTAPVDQSNNTGSSAGTSTGEQRRPEHPGPGDPTGTPTAAPLASPSTAPVGAAAPPADKGPFPPVANLIKDALDGDPSASYCGPDERERCPR